MGIADLLSRRRFAAAGLLAAALFLLYFLTRDGSAPFDALLTALSIRRPVFSGPAAALLSWNHFLWLPLTRLFYLAVSFTGAGTYTALLLFNAAAGAALGALTFLFLSRRVHAGWALAAAALAGVSHAVWLRSATGDPYLAGTLFAAGAAALLADLPEKPVRGRLAGAAALAVLAAYMHIGNLVLLPAAALAAAWRRGRQGLRNAAFLSGTALALLLPYIFFYDLYTPAGIAEWLAWGAGGVNGQAPGASASGQFRLDALHVVPMLFATLTRALAELPGGAGANPWLAGLPAAAFCAWALAGPRRARLGGPAFPSAAFFAAITLLFAVWIPGNIFYWAGPLLFLLWTAALLFADDLQAPPSRRAAAACALAVLLLGAANFRAVIGPAMKGAANAGDIAFCRALGAATPPGSVVLVSGRYRPYIKVGLPYFSGRQTFALELLFIQFRGTGLDPLAALRGRVDAALSRGLPVYLLGEVGANKDTFGPWGVSGGQIEDFLNSYRLAPAAQLGPDPGAQLLRLTPAAPR